MKNNLKRLLALALLIVLVLALPLNAFAESQLMRVNTESRVYQQPSLSSLYVRLPKNLEVNLLATNDGWAMIELNGNVGFTNAEHLSTVVETPVLDYDELMKDAKAARISVATRVYASPSTSSASLKVPANMNVNLLATNDGWALVENNGFYAYMKASQLMTLTDGEPAVILSNTRVYASASTSAKSLKVSKGMQVNLIATNGSWALVENGGVYAYIKSSKVGEKTEHGALVADGEPAVILDDTRVYASANTTAASLKVSKGMQVNLISVSGDWALVENAGYYAYMDSDLVALKSAIVLPTATPAPTATPEPEQPDYSHLLAGAQDGVLNADALVYKFADASSAAISAPKGTEVRLLTISDGWALVERDGMYGFVSSGKVSPAATATPVVTPTPTPVPTATPAPENYMTSSKYTNEEKCHMFLTDVGGLNCAAACGILANIRRESNFNPTSGGSYYGLCQWGGGRLTKLKNYCSENGYEYTSLEGQLRYLLYELQNNEDSVGEFLKSVPNTAQGAYDAGWHFCYYFERPAAKETASVSRGNLAKDTYFEKYN